MFYLIYVSSAVKLMDNDELLTLLEQSREKNLRLGITGMLLYSEGNFMQMLEGDRQVVLELYDAIRNDYRHKGVMTIRSDNIEERNFEDWSMGFFNMDKVGEFPKYSDYINKNLTLKSFRKDSHNAYRFMVAFHNINR